MVLFLKGGGREKIYLLDPIHNGSLKGKKPRTLCVCVCVWWGGENWGIC